MIKPLKELKRIKAYILSIIFFALFLLAGIFMYVFGTNTLSFLANIFISIAASILASIIVAIFIDCSDYKREKRLVEKEHDTLFFMLRFYTLNLNYRFITESINGHHNEIDTSKCSYDLMIEKLKEYDQLVLHGKRYTKKIKQFHNDLFLGCDYCLRIISTTLLDAINKNSLIHCFDKYFIDFININQYIMELFEIKATKMIASDLANIIDLLMNLKPIANDFKKPISAFKDYISSIKGD